ncbi:MAG: acyltransferase family protein [Acidimicrobiales bacterium]
MALAATQSSPPSIEYQPALDGLRAVAVVAVLLYHGGVSWAGAGFLGVDVFFALSGYLITSLLLAELDRTGRVNLPAFWARRARRLLPALFVTLFAVAAYAALLAPPETRDVLRGDGLAGLFYVANWWFIASDQSYFAAFADPSPLRHLWSLAIEEQWYIIWPLLLPGLLALLGWWRRGRLLVAVVGLAMISAALMAALAEPTGDPSRAYYGTDTHAHGLLIGAALAVAMSSGGRRLGTPRPWVVEGVGWVALAVIAAAVAAGDDTSAWLYDGGFVLVGVATSVVILAAVQPGDRPLRWVLSRPTLRGIGRISYGLYLWHWPVYVTLTPDRVGLRGVSLLLLRLAVTAAISAASFHLVEQPVRLGPLRSRRPLALAATTVALLAVVLVGTTRTAPSIETAGALTAGIEPGDVRVMLVGDSVAFSLGYQPESFPTGIAVEPRAQLGCGVARGRPVISGRAVATRDECDEWPTYWRDGIDTFEPDVAVLQVGAWEVLDHDVGGRRLEVGTTAYRDYLAKELDLALSILTRDDTPVAVLTVPCFDERDPELGAAKSERNDPERVAWVNDVLRDVAGSAPGDVELIELGPYLCPKGQPRPEPDGLRYRRDGVHFTPEGARAVWEWLAPQLIAIAGRS